MIEWPELPFLDTVMTTIVFYDFEKRLPIRQAKLLTENICKLLNETPSHAHVGFDEEGRKTRAPKFSTLDKTIEKGEFEDYSYIDAVKYFEKGNVRDCSLAVGVYNFSYGKRVTVHYEKEREQPIDIVAVLKEVLKFVSPIYGIKYGLTVREGPLWFVSGIWSSGMSDGLGRASGEFKQEYLFGKKFKEGFFRDVFPWSYLSRAHLDKTIEGMRFRDWIEYPLKKNGWLSKPKLRGTLSLLDNGSGIWELTEEEAAEVRPRMLKANLLMVKS